MTISSIIFQSILFANVLFLITCQKVTHQQDPTPSSKTKMYELRLQQQQSASIYSSTQLESHSNDSQSIEPKKVTSQNRAMPVQNLNKEKSQKMIKQIKIPSSNSLISQKSLELQETRLLEQIPYSYSYEVSVPLTQSQCDPRLTINDQGQCVSCGGFCFRCSFNSQTNLTECLECYQVETDKGNQIYPYLMYNKNCYIQTLTKDKFVTIKINSTLDKFFACPSFCTKCFITNGNYECIFFEQQYGVHIIDQTSSDLVNIFPCHGICSYCVKPGYQNQRCEACPPSYFKLEDSCFNCLQNSENKCFECEVHNYAFRCYECVQNYHGYIIGCAVCSNNCLKCLSPQTCLLCYPGYHRYEKQSTNVYCVICPQGCLNCQYKDNHAVCTQCYPGYYINSQDLCLACTFGCEFCSSPDICYVCISGYQITEVFTCVQKIERCIQYKNESCIQCAVGYIVVNNQCIYNQSFVNGLQYACRQQQFLQNFECKDVSSYESLTQNCIEYNKYYCTRCKIGYFLDYVDQTDVQKCSVCQLENCMDCKNNVFCRKCYDGYFLDVTNNYEKCLKCFESCKTCITKPTYCLSCKDGFYMTNSMICVSQIQFKFEMYVGTDFHSIDDVLNDIKDQLVSISYSQSLFMDKDAKQRYLQVTNISVGTIKSVPSTLIQGYISYPDADKIKQIYTRTKQQLSTPSVVQSMKIINVSFSQIKYCPMQHKYDQQTKSCNHLDIEHCAIYDQQNDNLTCKQCEVNLYPKLNNTFCSMNCLSLNNCQVCYDLLQCFICQDQFVKLNGKCFAQIPNCILYRNNNGSCHVCDDTKAFLSKNGLICYSFISDCVQYNDQGNCTKCKQNFYMSSISQLSPTQVTGICLACDSNCLTCQNSSTYCTSCNSSYIMSSSAVCIPNNLLNLKVKFNYQFQKMYQVLEKIILEIINQLPGATNFTDQQKKAKRKLLQITNVSNGSVIIDGYLGFTQISQRTLTKSNLESALAPGKTFAGIEVISSIISDSPIISPPCQMENCQTPPPAPLANWIIIVIACSGGLILIGTVILIVCLRKKYCNKEQEQEKTDSTESNKEKRQNLPTYLSNSLNILKVGKEKQQKNDDLQNITQGSGKKILNQNQQKWVHHNAI